MKYLVILLMVFSVKAQADHLCKNAEHCDSTPHEDEALVDSSHHLLSNVVVNTARKLDTFFGETDENDIYNRSYLRLSASYNWEENRHGYWLYQAKGKADLPKLAKRASIIISADTDNDNANSSINDQEDATYTGRNPATTDDTQVDAALRFAQDLKKRLKTDINLGLKGDWVPYIAGRAKLPFELTPNTFGYARQTLYWREDEGYGSKTELQIDHLIDRHLLLRWDSDGEINEEDDFWDTDTSLTLYQTLDSKRSLAYGISASAQNRPKWYVNYYRAGIRYRQQFYREWLYYEIEPAVGYSREFDGEIERNAGIALRLIVYIGNY